MNMCGTTLHMLNGNDIYDDKHDAHVTRDISSKEDFEGGGLKVKLPID